MTQALPPETRPYLIRAIHEWAVDHGFTPQLRVWVVHEDIRVPMEYVENDEIVLNIHPQSVKNLVLDNEYITCSARFAGRPFALVVPVSCVASIFTRENGLGISFKIDTSPTPPPLNNKRGKPASRPSKKRQSKRTPHLKVVK